MSFYLAETPTLEAVATEDERVLAQDLQTRVAEAVQQAESQAPVCEAAGAQQQAQDRLDRLRTAERALIGHAKAAREKIGELSEKALESLVEAAASGKKLEFKKLDDVAAGEAQIRSLGQAIASLAEHLIPRAQIASLREEAHALESKARALERIAQERAEKVLEQLAARSARRWCCPSTCRRGSPGRCWLARPV